MRRCRAHHTYARGLSAPAQALPVGRRGVAVKNRSGGPSEHGNNDKDEEMSRRDGASAAGGLLASLAAAGAKVGGAAGRNKWRSGIVSQYYDMKRIAAE